MNTNKERSRSSCLPHSGDHRSLDEKLIIVVCVLAAFILSVFLLLRMVLNQAPLLALNVFSIAFLLFIAAYVWITRSLKLIHIVLNVICLLLPILISYQMGVAHGIHWLYPAMLWSYYSYFSLPVIALLMNAIAFSCLIPLLMAMTLLESLHLVASVLLMNVIAFFFVFRTNRQQQRLKLRVDLDPLTGLDNRRAMFRDMKSAEHKVSKKACPVCVVLLDLDHFKKINDQFGHPVGDKVLKEFSQMLRSNIRKKDGCYRFGGEEFLILAVDIDLAGAQRMAEDLRRSTEGLGDVLGFDVTVSVGIAQWQPHEPRQSILSRADQALYLAKREGRNLVKVNAQNDDFIPPSELSPMKLTRFFTSDS